MGIVFQSNEGRRFESQLNFPNSPLTMSRFLLWQVGEYSAVPGYKTGTHPQVCIEIAVFLEGTGVMILDGQEYPGKEGSIFVIPESATHAVRADEKSPLRIFFLGFAFREEQCLLQPYRQMMEFYGQRRCFSGVDTVNLTTEIRAVLSEIYNAAPGYMQAIEHYVELIILLAWRNFTAPGMSLMPAAYSYNALYNIPSIYAVVRYIDDHIESVGDIRTLAGELGFSYAYLSHLFSSKAGITLQDYIRRKKMEYAQSLLVSGDTTVADVAAKCGYRNAAAFSRAFLRITGVSPSDFLRK